MKNRPHGIGGSDAAAILGMSNYCTNLQLWEILTKRRKSNFSDNEWTRYGKAAEKPLIELFKLDNPQYEVVDYCCPNSKKTGEYERGFVHPEYTFLFGHVDGVIMEGKVRGILEIKTCLISNKAQREIWQDAMPQNYYIQIIHYLLVTGFNFVILKAQLKSEYKGDINIQIKQYRLDRSDSKVQKDIQYLLKKELQFWEHVKTDRAPGQVLPSI